MSFSTNSRQQRYSLTILTVLRDYFQCGNIGKEYSKSGVTWTVADWNSISTVIIPFFLNTILEVLSILTSYLLSKLPLS